MTRFDIVPAESDVWIEARSSVHPVHVHASGLKGFVEADVSQGVIELEGALVQIEVEKLESGNDLIDRETRRRVDMRRHPRITGELTRAEATGSNGTWKASGDLTFHGVTRTVEGQVDVHLSDDVLTIEGHQTFDVRDWNLEPPKLLMLKVHPDVRVRIRVRAKRAES